MRLTSIRDRLRQSYLFVPLLCVTVSIVAALLFIELDGTLRNRGSVFAFSGGPDSARSILSTVSSSMITFTGLVFSITIVVLQLTSTQFSPRALRTFLRDRISQWSLGVFLATFTFSLVGLRSVRGGSDRVEDFVPGTTITAALLLMLVSIVLFAVYIHHVAHSVRAVSVIARIAAETGEALVRVAAAGEPATDPVGADGAGPHVVVSDRTGVITLVDAGALVQVAGRAGGCVTVLPAAGAFVPEGAPLLRITSAAAPDERCVEQARRAIWIATERTMQQDPAFGFRQLVDIADRALSPGVNDPSTAVQCLDQLHALLRRSAGTQRTHRVHRDASGTVRAVVRTRSWPELLALALDEIRNYGGASVRIHVRVAALLDDLATVAQGADLDAVHAQRALLDAWLSELPPVERVRADRRVTAAAQ